MGKQQAPAENSHYKVTDDFVLVPLNIVIVEDKKAGGFVGWTTDCPAALSQGKTIVEVKAGIIKAIPFLLEHFNQSKP